MGETPKPPPRAPVRASLRTFALLAALFGAAPASAQPVEIDPALKIAQQLFQEGREAMKRGDVALAIERFQHSQQVHPAAGTLLNLASAEEGIAKLTKAREHFEAALQLLSENDERIPVAKEAIERLRTKIPSLRIDRVTGAPAGMTVRLDTTPLPDTASQALRGAPLDFGVDRPLDPGAYVITTSAPGRQDRRYPLKLEPSAHVTISVEPGGEVLVIAPPVVAPPRSSGPSAMRSVGFVSIGVGLAGLGIGAALGVRAIVEKGNAASACPKPSACNATGLEASSTGHALAAGSTASFVIGLAGAALGVTLVVVGRDPAPAASAGLRVVGYPGGAGLGAGASF
jgi:hypothetical protein